MADGKKQGARIALNMDRLGAVAGVGDVSPRKVFYSQSTGTIRAGARREAGPGGRRGRCGVR